MRLNRWGWYTLDVERATGSGCGRLDYNMRVQIRRWHPGFWFAWLRAFFHVLFRG